MSNRRKKVLTSAIALLVLLLASDAVADVPIRTLSPTQCETQAGSKLELPPVVIVTHDQWERMDYEMRRLQDAETRLSAENKVLRDSASKPGIVTVISALALGILIGSVVL